MSIGRVATATQTAQYLNAIERAGSALDKTQTQIASGVQANTYAGFGAQAQVLTATLSATQRNTAYQTATSLASTQVSLQDTQLTSLSSLASQLKQAVSDAVANNDATSLMDKAQDIFEQASSILNSKDGNGDYIYSGGRADTAPVTATSLSDLASMSSVSSAFANGDLKKSVQVADGQTVNYGLTASGVGTGLMQALQSIANFNNSSDGDFKSGALSTAQNDYLTGMIGQTTVVASDLNAVTASNGYVSNRLTDATTQQGAMDTLYGGFVDKLQNTDMAAAATQLSLQQTQLQAALQVTSTLNQLTLLNYLPSSG